MHKFGAELNRKRREWIVYRQNAPAGAIRRFQTNDVLSPAAELGSGGKSCDARANDDDIGVCLHDLFLAPASSADAAKLLRLISSETQEGKLIRK